MTLTYFFMTTPKLTLPTDQMHFLHTISQSSHQKMHLAISFAPSKSKVALNKRCKCKMVNIPMDRPSHCISPTAMHNVACSKVCALSFRNASPMAHSSLTQPSCLRNAKTSSVHPVRRIAVAVGFYSISQILWPKNLSSKSSESRGYQVIFYPKFHCELSFIEQCWGFAKRIYCEFLASSAEADLERNVALALNAMPLDSMRR